MSDTRAEKRRARRASGVKATHELMTVFLEKSTAEDLRHEMEKQGVRGGLSQAEFAGTVLQSAISGMRMQRELREAAEARKANLVQAATPEETATILTRGNRR